VNPNEVKGKPVFCMPEMKPLAMLAWMFHGIDVYMVDVNQKSIKTRSTSKATMFK
jgi:hypothetical protein